MKKKNVITILLATVLLLMIPLIAMQFTNDVQWSVFDFIIMGILISGAGFFYEFISNKNTNIFYKAGTALAIGAGFVLLWVNLAVGLIGSEDNPANLLYAGVLAIGATGAFIARFRAPGMSRTLFTVALAQALVPVIALIVWGQDFSPGVIQVFILNGFFALLFAGSALLFRRAGDTGKTETVRGNEAHA